VEFYILLEFIFEKLLLSIEKLELCYVRANWTFWVSINFFILYKILFF